LEDIPAANSIDVGKMKLAGPGAGQDFGDRERRQSLQQVVLERKTGQVRAITLHDGGAVPGDAVSGVRRAPRAPFGRTWFRLHVFPPKTKDSIETAGNALDVGFRLAPFGSTSYARKAASSQKMLSPLARS
jgi:hypothetical protein